MFALLAAVLTASPSPSPSTSPSVAPVTAPLRAHAVRTPAPPKQPVPARTGISGVWEVQIQRDSGTTYTHLKLTQTGDALTGIYLTADNKRYPVVGTLNGENVKLTVTLSGGKTIHFTGTESEGTDMLGMVQMPSGLVGFTASYRPKYDWTDAISPNPGIGTGGGMGLPGVTPP